MGKMMQWTQFNIVIGTERENWLHPVEGFCIGMWGFHARLGANPRITRIPTGRCLFRSIAIGNQDAHKVILALDDAFPSGSFGGGWRPSEEWLWVFESVVAAALASDYVFGKVR